MKTKTFHYRIRRLCAFIIGVVFLLAGIFKLLDPTGAGLVVEEYLRFLHLRFLMPAAKGIGVGLALLEALLGAAMISGVWRKPVAVLTSVMIVCFTILTLFLAIFNPAMDCGCFGEVIHLTNLQTFLKNLVLLVLMLIAFLPYKDFGRNRKKKYVAFFLVAASLVAFAIYSLKTIPLVDYTAFTPGSELLASKGIDSEESISKPKVIYEKNGQEGVFDLDKLPDSTWTFVRTEDISVNGPELDDNVPILSFYDSLDVYCDEKAAEGNVMAVSVYDTDKVKGDGWTRISDLLEGASAAGFTPLLLTSTTKEDFDSLEVIVPEVREKLLGSLYFADYKTLISLNRSNGGATWFSDGQLIEKYPASKLPSGEKMLQMTGDDPTESMLRTSTKSRLRFQGFILYVFAVLLLL